MTCMLALCYGFRATLEPGRTIGRERRGHAVSDFDGGQDKVNPSPVLHTHDGVHQFINSKTYQPIAPAANTVAGIEELVIQAADRQRPYITLIPDADATEWIFEAAPKASDEDVRTLTLEGLWLGILPTGLGPPAGGEFTPVETLLVLDGEFDWVRITHCTLDPGGERARIDPTVSGRHPVRSLENEVGEGTHHRVVVLGAIRDSTSVRTPVRRGRLPFSILSCGIICV